ncbi:MAG: hypothetical protein IPF57_17945 [Gammaproteobacteria bacterium]|jgi:hypothetical protein|nr:hypothetical protein [Gammaproteobacteria bacterium]MBP7483207.1 hypothetical protein [Lacunisphaera sp.]
MYSDIGKASVAPERLIRASLLQVLSEDHFSTDGTLVEARASHRSLRRRDDDDKGYDTHGFVAGRPLDTVG